MLISVFINVTGDGPGQAEVVFDRQGRVFTQLSGESLMAFGRSAVRELCEIPEQLNYQAR